MSNNTDAKGALAGSVSAYGGEQEVNNLTDVVATYRKSALDAAANSVLADDQFFVNPFPFDLRIVSAVVKSDGTVAVAANAVGFDVKTDRGVESGAQATAFYWNTASGGVGTGLGTRVAVAGTGVATASTLPPGGGLYFNQTKLGSGLTMGKLELGVVLRRA